MSKAALRRVLVVIGAVVTAAFIVSSPLGELFAANLASPDGKARLQATGPITETVPVTGTGSPTITPTLSSTVAPTVSTTVTEPLPSLLPVATETAPGTVATTGTTQLPGPTPTVTQETNKPLVGTIVANRATTDARFFVEGQTYVLAPGRSEGLSLPRDTAVLNLYNCSAQTPETQEGCFWDPYLLRRDGFFEIYERPTNSGPPSLLLREAGAPPTDQVWVQNRTGTVESLVFRNEVIEIQPSSVKEFPVATGVPAILYVRSCITVNEQTVCEWSPKTLDAGMYYAMVDVEMPGSVPQSMISTIDLRPVLGDGTAEEPAVATGMECTLLVPALNVRSGPGLQYEIIAKVRGTETEPGRVVVIGRNPDSQWLAVDGRVAPGGWIAGSGDYVRCSGDVTSLALMESSQPQVAQVQVQPVPVAIVPNAPAGAAAATVEPAPEPTVAAEPEPTEEPGPPTIPPGQALLIVNNGFPFEIRFTVDQAYRPIEGPSEYDLQPGETMTLVVHPGAVAFSASSPWSSLSGNAEVTVAADQSVTMWVRFEQDPAGSANWVLRWQ